MFILIADVLIPESRQTALDILREIGIKALAAKDPELEPNERMIREALQVEAIARLAQMLMVLLNLLFASFLILSRP